MKFIWIFGVFKQIFHYYTKKNMHTTKDPEIGFSKIELENFMEGFFKKLIIGSLSLVLIGGILLNSTFRLFDFFEKFLMQYEDGNLMVVALHLILVLIILGTISYLLYFRKAKVESNLVSTKLKDENQKEQSLDFQGTVGSVAEKMVLEFVSGFSAGWASGASSTSGLSVEKQSTQAIP